MSLMDGRRLSRPVDPSSEVRSASTLESESCPDSWTMLRGPSALLLLFEVLCCAVCACFGGPVPVLGQTDVNDVHVVPRRPVTRRPKTEEVDKAEHRPFIFEHAHASLEGERGSGTGAGDDNRPDEPSGDWAGEGELPAFRRQLQGRRSSLSPARMPRFRWA